MTPISSICLRSEASTRRRYSAGSVAEQLPGGGEIQPLRHVAALVGGVAGGLVGGQFHRDVVVDGVLPQVDDVAVVGDGDGVAGGARSRRPGESLLRGPR